MSEEEKAKAEEKKLEEDKKRRPLIPKSAILRLLAELVKSYANCAQLITQHHYSGGQSELVAEVSRSSHVERTNLLQFSKCA